MDKIEIEKIIENLWQKAPKWANYIAVDFDGYVFVFENQPYCNPQHGTEWNRKCNATNLNRVYSMACIDAEFPNWDELIFERPVITKQPINSENNQLTPLLQKLRNYLDTTPREQINAYHYFYSRVKRKIFLLLVWMWMKMDLSIIGILTWICLPRKRSGNSTEI